MFCFTLDELKESLKDINPATRKSLVGLYKHNNFVTLGNYLKKNNLGYIEESPFKVYLNYPYNTVSKINIFLSELISKHKTLIDKDGYGKYANVNYKHLHGYYNDYSNKELQRVYELSKTEGCILLAMNIRRLIYLQHFANKVRNYLGQCKVSGKRIDISSIFQEDDKIATEIKMYLVSWLSIGSEQATHD
jgi:hypothetical protein